MPPYGPFYAWAYSPVSLYRKSPLRLISSILRHVTTTLVVTAMARDYHTGRAFRQGSRSRMRTAASINVTRCEPGPRVKAIGRTSGTLIGAPYGTRTRVSAVKGRCPRPLDEGR